MSHTPLSALLVYEAAAAGVADAVAAGLAGAGARVVGAPLEEGPRSETADYDLIVVGASAASFLTSRPLAPLRAALPDPAFSLREWLAALPAYGAGEVALAAAFEARVARVPRWSHTAAVQASLALGRRGYRLASLPGSFCIHASDGLAAGAERQRAVSWAAALAQAAQLGPQPRRFRSAALTTR